MDTTNVKLSENEMRLVTDSAVILTKISIIQKVYSLFGNLCSNYQAKVAAQPGIIPAEVLAISPKIYKGENYVQLPYVMMDYPRCFSRQDVFAIRSFFWWGNFFSISLHLSGKYQQQFEQLILQKKILLDKEDWYLQTGDDPWQNDINSAKYVRLREIEPADFLSDRPFIKLAKKIPLSEWDNAFTFYGSNYLFLLNLLNNNQ